MARLRKKAINKIAKNESISELLKIIDKEIQSELHPKFTIVSITPKEEIERVQNRKVMDVSEYEETSPIGLGDYKAWNGSVEMEYFSIIFMKGVMTISLAEREMDLIDKPINYAILTKLHNLLKTKTKLECMQTYAMYNNEGYKDDLKSITFNDIMKALKWTFHSEKVKVKKGIIFPT